MSDLTRKDILKHYFSSVLVYGLILLFAVFCPLYSGVLEKSSLNYAVVLGIYYALYIIFALPVFFIFKPDSVKESRNVAIVGYIARQFKKYSPMEKLANFEMSDFEKQSFVITFIKAFFGVYCVNLLCTKFIPSLDYDISFLGAMLNEAVSYAHAQGFVAGIAQFIDDSSDMLISLSFFITTLMFAISYLTEAKFLRNKIQYADVTPLGIISCIACYYPFTILVGKFLPLYTEELIPTPDVKIRVILHILLVIACFTSMIAILRLGTKSGNLTNRGIVTGFPYNIVRHPDYGAQMLTIILLFIPVYTINTISISSKILFTCGTLIWLSIYYLRALTEERNLVKDEKYAEYMGKVKKRFIPWIF